MSQYYLTRFLILLIIMNFLISTAFSSTSSIKQQISQVSSKISQDTKKQNELTQSLKTTEKNIGDLTIKAGQLNETIASHQKKIKTLDAQRDEDQAKLKAQQAALAELLRANYLLQRQGALGIYAGGHSREKTLRYLRYYQALDNSLLHAIQAQQKTIAHLSSVLNEIREKNNDLNQSFSSLEQERHHMLKEQSSRKKILQGLHTTIQSNQEKLDKLKNDQQALKKIVTVAAPKKKTLTVIPSPKHLSFAEQRAMLPAPTQGKRQNLFGTPIANSSVNWQGNLFHAPLGTDVRSVYAGTVVYADWLRGYGLLMIIDHGNGYMSLYGRNNALYRKEGDKVNSGDKIATVGESGGFTSPALYFEIRHDGVAVNPNAWLLHADGSTST